MIKDLFFEMLNDSYHQLSKEISESNVTDNLLIDYESDLNEMYLLDMHRLKEAICLLQKAQLIDDKITMQAALVYIRVHSMRLSGFFEDIKDDSDTFLKNSEWPNIPENYQVPEHYNYPNK
ncbi:hypothetical protein CE143_06815 [Photorhabdus luminescens]|uniref:Uncharacterized protein n=2 Tax=Photorhabdus TaxID=29487 RepID=A0A1C0TY88_9GAMM|nr:MULTISPECIES: hypothetical protein [Photorhabdus]UJD74705.1 hypothetical protein CE143_06815 [Photorhabdus luminescens]MBS9434687.1 hypothetical protein [Photorhabdus hainanensis]MBS9441743.1 hypothetical protein [Photorhabdus heterorhabditis]MCC8459406.1 hypothetical protein [Photorhabdus aegyptia]OCQ50632.1 hypothetical protein Ppb6_04199 [Photorhabdus australis subsp. thailandensis]